VATVVFWIADAPTGAVISGVLCVVAAANLAWVTHRKRRGEPG
jgi:hypothetical protein